MIWVCLFASLIAANAGATIITKTHITTTKIAVSAQLDTHPLENDFSDTKITTPNAISIGVSTPGIGADKRQVSNNTTASIIRSSNGTSTNADLGPGIVDLTASSATSNQTAHSRGSSTTAPTVSVGQSMSATDGQTNVATSGGLIVSKSLIEPILC